MSLANWWWEAIDFTARQSSLNHAQARLDADGVFRGVIAHEDPGVPNWLDTAGHERGTLIARFVMAEEAPVIRSRSVKLAALRDELPADDAARRARASARPRSRGGGARSGGASGSELSPQARSARRAAGVPHPSGRFERTRSERDFGPDSRDFAPRERGFRAAPNAVRNFLRERPLQRAIS